MSRDTEGWTRRRVRSVALATLWLASGCAAYRRPPELTPAESELLAGPPLPYDVTVAWWDTTRHGSQNPDAYASSLAKLVTESRVFRSARYRQSASTARAELVATSTGTYCNTAVIPLLTILSLGVIPTIFDDQTCEGMELQRPGSARPNAPVRIEFEYKGRVIMGWFAALAGLRPGWGFGDVQNDERYRQRFRLAVLQHRAEIERLATP